MFKKENRALNRLRCNKYATIIFNKDKPSQIFLIGHICDVSKGGFFFVPTNSMLFFPTTNAVITIAFDCIDIKIIKKTRNCIHCKFVIGIEESKLKIMFGLDKLSHDSVED